MADGKLIDSRVCEPVTEHEGDLEWHNYIFRFFNNHNIAFLDLIQYQCMLAGIRKCNFKRCRSYRKHLDRVIPDCAEWEQFRIWNVTALSCQLTMTTAGHRWLRNFTPIGFHNVVEKVAPRKMRSGRGPSFQVYEILYFALSQVFTVIKELAHDEKIVKLEQRDWRSWWTNHNMFPQEIAFPAVDAAADTAKKFGICSNRLWNLAYSADRAQGDMPALIEILEKAPRPDLFAHHGHSECSAELCEFSHESSVLKEQHHKCQGAKFCDQVSFRLEDLVRAVWQGLPTAWPIRNILRRDGSPISLSLAPQKYIAISHVWSDGTGVGTGGPGHVNECLVSYFANICEQLDCDGIWWDTICVPMERAARRRALSYMHLNYERAQHTIVHDRYLLQIPWAEDGSPALALVLSPWFTRGWTALELSTSQSVKVLYRHPTRPDEYVIKDLDHDILVRGFSRLGLWVATSLIQRLRGKQPSMLELFKCLGTRVTSWPRDRICIAALLARTPDYDYNDSQAVTTRKIINSYQLIPKSLLLHGHVTLTSSGGFSWCPSNLMFGEMAMYEARDPLDVGVIDAFGAICGSWFFRPLNMTDSTIRLRPYSFHKSLDGRIKEALRSWQTCVLLSRHRNVDPTEPLLLVNLTGVVAAKDLLFDNKACGGSGSALTSDNSFIRNLGFSHFMDCHPVGCVIEDFYETSNSLGSFRSGMGGPRSFRIGTNAGKPALHAIDVGKAYKQVEEHPDVRVWRV